MPPLPMEVRSVKELSHFNCTKSGEVFTKSIKHKVKRQAVLAVHIIIYFRQVSVILLERYTLLTIEKVLFVFICHTSKYCILLCACVACLVVCKERTSMIEIIAEVTILFPITWAFNWKERYEKKIWTS